METTQNMPMADSEERFATLTGFRSPKSSQGQGETQRAAPLLSDEDLEEQITRHSFAESPLSKLIFVAGGVFLIVFVASLFLAQFQAPGESVTAKQQNEINKSDKSPLLSDSKEDKEKAELLSELALREQKERLNALNDSSNTPKTLPKPTPEPKSIPNRQVVTTQPVKPAPVSVPRQVYVPPRVQPNYRFVPKVQNLNHPPTSQQEEEPTQTWNKLAKLGSYGVSSQETVQNSVTVSTKPLTDEQHKVSPLETRQNSVPEIAPTNRTVPYYEPPTLPTEGGYSTSNVVTIGQSASAILETPLAWEHSTQQDVEAIITLKDPLKDKLGNVLVPGGSKLIAKVQSGNGGLVTLVPEKFMLPRQGDWVEVSIAQGSLSVQGTGGEPLFGQARTVGGNGGSDNSEILTDLLSVTGDVGNIQGLRSLGSLERLLGGGRRSSTYGFSTTIWVLRQGTNLEIYVNKPLPIIIPEKPLELDLSAIGDREIAQSMSYDNGGEPVSSSLVDTSLNDKNSAQTDTSLTDINSTQTYPNNTNPALTDTSLTDNNSAHTSLTDTNSPVNQLTTASQLIKNLDNSHRAKEVLP